MTAITAQSLPAAPGQRATGMPAPLSVYLDLTRLCAAVLVFLMHSHYYLTPQLTYFVSYGRESVAIFFVLSGFVIAFVSNEKRRIGATILSPDCRASIPSRSRRYR